MKRKYSVEKGPSSLKFNTQGEIYLNNCQKLEIKPDLKILTSLETNWKNLTIVAGELLPLKDIIVGEHSSITNLTLLLKQDKEDANKYGSYVGDLDVKLLCDYILPSRGCRLTELNLSFLNLQPESILLLAHALKESKIERLNISNNPSTLLKIHAYHEAYAALADSLKENNKHNHHLVLLDVSYNRIGFNTLKLLKRKKSKKLKILSDGNHFVEEMLNVASHLFGFLVSLIAVGILLYYSTVSIRLFWSVSIYCLCLVLMFGCSATFHASTFHSHETYTLLKILDHSVIYLLIAGSSSPFLHVALKDLELSNKLALFQWLVGAGGITLGAYSAHHKIPFKFFFELALYFFQALILLCVRDELTQAVGNESMELIYATGFSYLFGSIFYIAEHTVHPIGHPLWHLCVISGVVLHYLAVFRLVASENEKFYKISGDVDRFNELKHLLL